MLVVFVLRKYVIKLQKLSKENPTLNVFKVTEKIYTNICNILSTIKINNKKSRYYLKKVFN